MDSRSGSAETIDDCGELSRLRRERHRLLLRVSGGRISEVAGGTEQTSGLMAARKDSCTSSLTCQLWNDGRRVLVQVIHAACDGVGRHAHSRHHHPAVVRVEGGRQAGQTLVVDDGEAAELLDLLPAMQPLPQARRDLRQGFPSAGGGQNVRFQDKKKRTDALKPAGRVKFAHFASRILWSTSSSDEL